MAVRGANLVHACDSNAGRYSQAGHLVLLVGNALVQNSRGKISMRLRRSLKRSDWIATNLLWLLALLVLVSIVLVVRACHG
jgi:hypothetical protein